MRRRLAGATTAWRRSHDEEIEVGEGEAGRHLGELDGGGAANAVAVVVVTPSLPSMVSDLPVPYTMAMDHPS
jgi:hypothetical protein